MGKSILAGAVIAITLVVVLGLGGYLYLNSVGPDPDARRQERVVVVFESAAEDGATVAALISVVEDGKMLDVSPDSSVTVPGTSFSRIGDAFVFGGAAGVARAIGDANGAPTAFVSVPQPVWLSAVEATSGVRVDMPLKITSFDGVRLTTIPSGEQTLTADQVAAVLSATPKLTQEESASLRRQLGRSLGGAVAAARPAPGALKSDLPPDVLALWVQGVLSDASIGRGH